MSPLGWSWVLKCRLLGGNPTLELHDEAVAAGGRSLDVLSQVLAKRCLRERLPPEDSNLPIHAARLLAAIGEPGGIPALMGMLTDPVDPGLYGEEAALALGRCGPLALAPLIRVARAKTHDTWVRGAAVRGLMFACMVNRLHRARTLATYEAMLLDASERDSTFLAHLVNSVSQLAAMALLPSIATAYAAGRVDEDVVDYESVEIDLLTRHQRPDPETKRFARRNLREHYADWEEMTSGLSSEEREDLAARMRALDASEQGPPPEWDDVESDDE